MVHQIVSSFCYTLSFCCSKHKIFKKPLLPYVTVSLLIHRSYKYFVSGNWSSTGSGMRSCSSFSLWSAWTSLTEKGEASYSFIAAFHIFSSFYLFDTLSLITKTNRRCNVFLSVCKNSKRTDFCHQVSLHHPQAEVSGGSVCE